MDWKQFIANIVSSLAWPAIALVFILIFRGEVARIVKRLTSLELPGGMKAQFSQLEEKAEKMELEKSKKPKVDEDQPEGKPELASLENQVMDLADRSPSAAVLLAWSGVESAISKTVAKHAVSPEPPLYRSPLHNIKMLEKAGLISTTFLEVLNELRGIRNTIAHTTDAHLIVTTSESLDYARKSLNAINELERL
jgi:hypothetical protein